MNNKEELKDFSLFNSPFEEEREARKEIYGLEEYEGYYSCSDYENYDYTQNKKGRIGYMIWTILNFHLLLLVLTSRICILNV